MTLAPRPVRLRLSRAKGFNLQEHSRAVNGLPVVNVARPGKFGNPFSVKDAADVYDCRRRSAHIAAVKWFKDWLDADENEEAFFGPLGCYFDTLKRRNAVLRDIGQLRGKNLACFCPPEFQCHADVLLELANRPTCEAIDD